MAAKSNRSEYVLETLVPLETGKVHFQPEPHPEEKVAGV